MNPCLETIASDQKWPPVIPAVTGELQRPKWSVMIPTYNCADYLRYTLWSLLDQAPGADQMQIEVVDDCSTKDDPEAVVEEIGGGRVLFFRQPQNLGAIENFNTCVRRSRGHYVHLLHGDDLVYPGFYTAFEEALIAKKVGIIFCRSLVIDDHGAIDGISPRIVSLEIESRDHSAFHLENPIRTPGVVLRRSVYEEIGGFLPALQHTADWEMWVRAIQASGAFMINKPLAGYRFFPLNDTSRMIRTGANLVDMHRCAQILNSYAVGFSMEKFVNVLADVAYCQARQAKDENSRDAASGVLNELVAMIPPGLVRPDRYGLRSSIAIGLLSLALWCESLLWRVKWKLGSRYSDKRKMTA